MKDEEDQQVRNLFKAFFEQVYQADIVRKISLKKTHLVIDFSELINYDPSLGDRLLDHPTDTLHSAELALEESYKESGGEWTPIIVRCKNLPNHVKKPMSHIRPSKDIGHMILCEGLVKSRTDVMGAIISTKYECPNCGQVFTIIQTEKILKQPTKCGCGRKGKMRIIEDPKIIDGFALIIEESPEAATGSSKLRKIQVLAKSDLTDLNVEPRIYPGVRIGVSGELKPFHKYEKGQRTTEVDVFIDANYIKIYDDETNVVKLTDADIVKIKEVGRRVDILDHISKSIFYGIYSYDKEKAGLILQMLGGVRKTGDSIIERGDIHILLVGDPGQGKSQLLKSASQFHPKARYNGGGTGTSVAGLTAAVVRDELTGAWSLEAGELPMTHKGMLCIDELDKMPDKDGLHEGLEQQTVSIAKAGIIATLQCQTSVLAAANPKTGKFDYNSFLFHQIDLKPTLINRFDLIFPIKDTMTKEQNAALADTMLGRHRGKVKDDCLLTKEFVKKYILYARNLKPVLDDSAADLAKEKFVELRDKANVNNIPITPRQFQAIVRLAEANAKLRLSDTVIAEDVQFAYELIMYNIKQIATDPETGKVDVWMVDTGVPESKRNIYFTVRQKVHALSLEKNHQQFEVVELLNRCSDLDSDKVEEAINKLCLSGDLIEPQRGWLRLVL